MASGGDERRMLFDLRGRRKNVVKVVYAFLALLMGASLFVAVGPFNIGELFNSSPSSEASSAFVEQAEKAEVKLKKNPEDPQQLLALTKARIGAGNAKAELNPETGAAEITGEGRQELLKASEAWSRYLKTTDEPNVSGAQAAASMFFGLAQTSRTGAEAEASIRSAAQAQRIVAEQRPSLGSLSSLAIYQTYSFQYDEAKRSQNEAKKFANTKFERENLENELEQIEKRAREFQKQLAEAEKEAKKARAEGKAAPNALSEGGNPLGLGGP